MCTTNNITPEEGYFLFILLPLPGAAMINQFMSMFVVNESKKVVANTALHTNFRRLSNDSETN